METILNQFPEYQPNQVLTETSLNATSDFLEQQERLTRFGLTKTGIIENLVFKVVENGIQIEEGFGVSRDGYFIAHQYKNGSQIYSYAKPYSVDLLRNMLKSNIGDLDHNNGEGTLSEAELRSNNNIAYYELLTLEQAQEESEVSSIQNLLSGNFKIILFLEITKVQQDQCSTTSCDASGALRTYRVVPILIQDDADDLIRKINKESKLKNRIKLKRLSNLHHLLKSQEPKDYYNTIIAEYARVNHQNTIMLIDKLEQIVLWDYPVSVGHNFENNNLINLREAIKLLDHMLNTYIPLVNYRSFPYNYGYVAQQVPKSTIPKATDKFLRLTQGLRTNRILRPTNKKHPNAEIHFQAYYEFCFNLEQAINEFILEYNEFVDHYFSSYGERLNRILVLGKNGSKDRDPYRYYVIENFANLTFREAKDKFFRFFNRIPILIDKFYQGFDQLHRKNEIKLIPSRFGNSDLEDTAIPYYFQQDLELDVAWMVTHNKVLKTDIYQYRDMSAPYSHFAYNISSYNFIRVEGVIGKLIPKLRTFLPPKFDLSNLNLQDLTKKDTLVKDLSKSLLKEANTLVNIKFQNQIKMEIANDAIRDLQENLVADLKLNHKLDDKVVNTLVEQVSIDLTKKLDVGKMLVKSETTLSEIDKQIDMFNIPLNYDILSVEELDKSTTLRYLEPSLGTKMGGTLIFLTKAEENGNRIIGSFMKYF